MCLLSYWLTSAVVSAQSGLRVESSPAELMQMQMLLFLQHQSHQWEEEASTEEETKLFSSEPKFFVIVFFV